MSASNKGPGVDYRLQNLTNALYLDGNNDVVVRTGFAGNIVISGNVNVPGDVTVNSTPDNPVHVHLTELGTFGNLTTYVPVRGNVSVDNFPAFPSNVSISQMPAITGNVGVSGNVSISQMPGVAITNFPSNIRVTDGSISVTNFPGNVRITDMPGISGNVRVYGNVSIDQLPGIAITSLPEVEIKNDTGNPVPISANTSPNSATNRIYVSGLTDIAIADSTYWMNVTRGLVPGQYLESKNGYRTGMNGGTEASIWAGPTDLYPWSSWTVAQNVYIVSTNAADTQTLIIEGLLADYSKQTETITITGTTPVVTVNDFLRINRCNISVGNSNAGTITLRLDSGTGTVVGIMDPGFGRIKGGYVTIPKGYTGYMLNMSSTQFRSGSGNIGGVLRVYSRLPNGPFIAQVIAEVVNGQWHQELTYPLVCPQYMDIDFRLVPDGNGTQGTCFYQLLYIAM